MEVFAANRHDTVIRSNCNICSVQGKGSRSVPAMSACLTTKTVTLHKKKTRLRNVFAHSHLRDADGSMAAISKRHKPIEKLFDENFWVTQ